MQDILIELFSRMKFFFKRLDMYMKVRPTEAMMDITVKIVVEVISILGIVTKETRQGRISMPFLVDSSPKSNNLRREICQEVVWNTSC